MSVPDNAGRSHSLPGDDRLYNHAPLNPTMQQGHTNVTRQMQAGHQQIPSRQQQPPMYEQPMHSRQAPQQPVYEQHQHVYYGGPQRVEGGVQNLVQAQVVPSGHTIYVNAPQNAPPYGYATVQFHPHSQHANIVHLPQHQQVSASSHPQEYISVVPVQGGPPGTSYAYWNPELQGGGAVPGQQTVAIMPGGAPIKVARMGGAVVDPSPHVGGRGHPGTARISPEKGSKNRRGGGSSSLRRAANEPKHGAHPATSPLLEEFRASKNRDWTILDIEGETKEKMSLLQWIGELKLTNPIRRSRGRILPRSKWITFHSTEAGNGRLDGERNCNGRVATSYSASPKRRFW